MELLDTCLESIFDSDLVLKLQDKLRSLPLGQTTGHTSNKVTTWIIERDSKPCTKIPDC